MSNLIDSECAVGFSKEQCQYLLQLIIPGSCIIFFKIRGIANNVCMLAQTNRPFILQLSVGGSLCVSMGALSY